MDQRPPQDGPAQVSRPRMARRRPNRLPWIFAGGLLICGLLLFQTLEARRAAVVEPSVLAPRDDRGAGSSTSAELVIPPEVPDFAPPAYLLRPVEQLPQQTAPARPDRIPQAPRSGPQPVFNPRPWSDQTPPPFIAAPAASVPSPTVAAAPGSDTGSGKRSVARRFANPGTTVPRGTVIQAVLESALDSTRGGFARAIVTRDIDGFDGSRILIQRGSRIIGEYRSDVASGQSRILIQWQRLTRPDGVIIDIDSPSADPLGRAGVKGSVNTHFFERFSGAILQSTLDIGVQLAARSASRDTVVLALPGSVQQATQIAQPQQIQPTVKVRQGSSVSVFVAQDLDFTSVDK